ncbi:MAG: hypothetical protein M1814_004329 [Vezdaea aestivalis]|nr:MAG: hypothetical protein M1814_004329 [Vezdaea aestivalis]
MVFDGRQIDDEHNFTQTPEAHRLPTVSASLAISGPFESSVANGPIQTGLPQLDLDLQDRITSILETDKIRPGGLSRRQITEIFGPPGSGKTALAIQTCTNAINRGQTVVWIDCGGCLAGPRLRGVVAENLCPEETGLGPSTEGIDNFLLNLHHFSTPSLAHLVALLFAPSSLSRFIKPSLVIIDSLSLCFPPTNTGPPLKSVHSPSKAFQDTSHWLSARALSISGDFITRLNRYAATKNTAVVVLTQTNLRARENKGASMQPALKTDAWDRGLTTRIVVFRDWADETTRADVGKDHGTCHTIKARFACVMKRGGVKIPLNEAMDRITSFEINQAGIAPLAAIDRSRIERQTARMTDSKKRKFEDDIEEFEAGEQHKFRVPSDGEESDSGSEYRRSALESALEMFEQEDDGMYDHDSFM